MIPPFEFLGKTFGIYPILALLGAFASGIFACRQAKKQGLDDNHMLCLLLWGAVGALLGGTLLYGLVNFPLVVEAFQILAQAGLSREFLGSLFTAFGGSVFYGGLLGGLLFGGIYYKKKSLPPIFLDLGALAIPLFHCFGRVGCFLGGCCYGIACSLGFVYTQNPIALANGVRRFPVQLLEALFCLGLFFLLFRLFRQGRLRGRLLALYLCLYSAGRFLLEFLRGDAYRGFLWGLSTSQLISIPLLLAGLGFLLIGKSRGKKGLI